MPTVHDLDDDAAKFLREAYFMLWAGFAASLLAILIIWKPVLGLAWIVQWMAGLTGISRSARIIPVNPLVKYASFILTMAPVFGIPPLGWFLLRTHRFLNAGDPPPADAQPAAPAPRQAIPRTAEAAAASAPPRPAAPAVRPGAAPTEASPPAANPAPPRVEAARAAGALPSIKAAGLTGMPDGQRLRAKIDQPGVAMTEADEPVILTAKSTFALAYVVDEGSHFSWLTMGRLREAGMDLPGLHRTALGNLRRRVQGEEGPGLTLHAMGNAWGMAMGGDHEAALVLLDELWDGPLKQYTPNGAVAAIPARDICAFCDARSAEGLEKLRGVVRKVTEGGRGLVSDKLFVRREGNWAPLG